MSRRWQRPALEPAAELLPPQSSRAAPSGPLARVLAGEGEGEGIFEQRYALDFLTIPRQSRWAPRCREFGFPFARLSSSLD